MPPGPGLHRFRRAHAIRIAPHPHIGIDVNQLNVPQPHPTLPLRPTSGRPASRFRRITRWYSRPAGDTTVAVPRCAGPQRGRTQELAGQIRREAPSAATIRAERAGLLLPSYLRSGG
jgi:hypothetical protein